VKNQKQLRICSCQEKFFLKVKKTFNRIIFFFKKNKIGGKAVYVSACHASRRPPCRCTSILNVSAILIDTIGRPPQKSNSTHTHTRWREMNKPRDLTKKITYAIFFLLVISRSCVKMYVLNVTKCGTKYFLIF